MAAVDFKKEFPDLYLPKAAPSLIDVPPMTFIMIDGQGDPNEEEGAYAAAVGLLYALSYTIKMSKMGGAAPAGYFEYVVPPLEGLWWMAGDVPGVDFHRKDQFCWTGMIRQPEFVTEDVFRAACEAAARKKKLDTAPARLARFEEGLCVQCMHVGPYDAEPATVEKMERFIKDNGLVLDLSPARKHHEIYLGDPRKTAPDKLKTVIRHPVKR